MLENISKLKVLIVDKLKVKYSININIWKAINKISKIDCVFYENNLYIDKNKINLENLIIEYSKLFGEIKGLDPFLLLLISKKPQEREGIMKIQGIEKLPKKENDFLKEKGILKDLEDDGEIKGPSPKDRESVKYVLNILKNELIEKYPNVSSVEETEEGFKLEKDGSCMVRQKRKS